MYLVMIQILELIDICCSLKHMKYNQLSFSLSIPRFIAVFTHMSKTFISINVEIDMISINIFSVVDTTIEKPYIGMASSFPKIV